MLSCCSWWFFCFCPDRFRGKRQSKPRSSRSRKKSLWRSFAALGVGIASQKLLGHRFFEDLQSACHDLLLLRFSKPLVSGEIIWIPRAYCDKCGGRKLCCRFLDAISCSLEPSVKLVQALPLSAPILATFKSEPSNSEGLKNSSHGHHQTVFFGSSSKVKCSHTHVVLHVTGKWDTSVHVD